MIDASKFSVNERAGEYTATIEVRGQMRLSLTAESIEDARAQAQDEADSFVGNPYDIELDEVEDVTVSFVRPKHKLYRVLEGGRKMQVSRLTDAHTPREPDERGF